ncbi:MAG: competence/damage-inducible protein A [Candidatus Melainabacteria bacterium]|nr:competence/damage-inducible protein A [Candidatus Melainabacteria bacterium]
MKAEIISVGTELLLGQITNTNASYLAQELKSLGIESHFQSTVGDNVERIHEVLNQALNRADLIITTGGLGPTPDDLTHEAISSFFKTKLFLDKKVLKNIKEKFYLKGYKKMPTMNIKQAYKPKDAKWIPNKLGTANGIKWRIRDGNVLIMTFPGVPRELYHMWEDTAKPYLKKLTGKNVIYSRTLKFTGIGESALADKIKSYFNLQNPTVAPYASIGEVKIRITSKEKSLKKAKKLVQKVTNKILKKTKKYFFGKDNDTLESLVAKKLTTQNKTIAIAESCTGGLLSKRLTDIPGSSKYIKLNVVTYSNEAKNKILNVPQKLLTKYGAVSFQVAKAMAIGVKKLAKTNLGLSITGIAGPSGSTKTKPVGLVYFGLAKENKIKTIKMLFGKNSIREEIRWLATQFALNWIGREL